MRGVRKERCPARRPKWSRLLDDGERIRPVSGSQIKAEQAKAKKRREQKTQAMAPIPRQEMISLSSDFAEPPEPDDLEEKAEPLTEIRPSPGALMISPHGARSLKTTVEDGDDRQGSRVVASARCPHRKPHRLPENPPG